MHGHNESAAADGIIGLLSRGLTVALVSDAGTPGISDPGARVVAAVAFAGFTVECVPGPVALIAALVVSGLGTDRFVFEGFLPRKGSERRARLAVIEREPRTVVLYESPHRVDDLLRDLALVCGADRRVSISRELTKRFETTWRGNLGGALASLGEGARGEYVIVLEGAPPEIADPVDDGSIRAELAAHVAAGASTRSAVDAVAAATGRSRREVYRIATERTEISQ